VRNRDRLALCCDPLKDQIVQIGMKIAIEKYPEIFRQFLERGDGFAASGYMQAIPVSAVQAINKRTKAVLKGRVLEGKSVTVPSCAWRSL
jgi:hypothetical protein